MTTSVKKTIAIILASAFLLLSGCSADKAPKIISDLLESVSLMQIEELGEKPGGVFDACFNGKQLALLVVEDFTEENSIYALYTVNASNAKVTAKRYLDDVQIVNPYGLEFDENGDIVMYGTHEYVEGADEEEQQKEYEVTFSHENLEIVIDETVHYPDNDEEKNGILDIHYAGNDYLSYSNSSPVFEDKSVYAFREDNERIFYLDDGDFLSNESFGKRVVGTLNTEENEPQTVVVYDFDKSVLLNKVTVDKKDEEHPEFVTMSKINDKYAFFCVETDDCDNDVYTYRFYIWKYTIGSLNTPVEITAKTLDDLNNENKKLCADISGEYGIDIHINELNERYTEPDEEYYLVPEAQPFYVNVLLNELTDFLSRLPDGFVKEIYTDMPWHEYDGFDIYIGSEIVGTASAYTESYTEKMTITFATDSSDYRTIAHEFMHAIDIRIDDWLGEKYDKAIFEVWEEYNPDYFYYNGYGDDGDFEYNEETEQYFISAYAMSTDAEDRAELFSAMFTDSFENETAYWYDDYAPLRKKADYLCVLIRNAYPSLENIETAQWEKSIKNQGE